MFVFSAYLHVEASSCCRRLSVCLSVCQTRGLWQNERKFCRHSYTIWKENSSSVPTRRMVGGGRPLVPEILGQTDPVASKTATKVKSIIYQYINTIYDRAMFLVSWGQISWSWVRGFTPNECVKDRSKAAFLELVVLYCLDRWRHCM